MRNILHAAHVRSFDRHLRCSPINSTHSKKTIKLRTPMLISRSVFPPSRVERPQEVHADLVHGECDGIDWEGTEQRWPKPPPQRLVAL